MSLPQLVAGVRASSKACQAYGAIFADMVGNGLQVFTKTGPQHAAPGVQFKEGAMPAANNAAAVGVEVFMPAPGQRRALHMWAGVAVNAKVWPGVGQTHRKHRIAPCAPGVKAARLAHWQVIEVAKVSGRHVHSMRRWTTRCAGFAWRWRAAG